MVRWPAVGWWSVRKRTAATRAALLILLGFPVVTPVLRAQPEALYVRTLAATCANCHGSDGHAVAGATVPGLAGQPREHFLQQMKAFRDGTRPATVMHQIAKGYTDAQLEQLAGYFAAQPR